MKNRIVLLTIPLGLLIVLLLFAFNLRQKSLQDAIPVIKQLPVFSLEASSGEPFDQTDLKGKINVVDFIFTRCMGPCPVMSGHMKNLYDKYNDENNLQFVSISVDPKHDTQQVLQDYARKYGVDDDRWVFLRGEMESIKDLSENGFLLAADDLPTGHTIRWVLVDQDANIRGYYEGTQDNGIESLEKDFNILLRTL